MDIKDLERLNSNIDAFKQSAEMKKGVAAKLSTPKVDNSYIHHDIRLKAEKVVREERQVELLEDLLQSNRDADKKTDIMLAVVIITCVLTFISLIFL